MRRRSSVLRWMLVACALALAASASAQRKKISLDTELVIEGNIQKPEAFFILPRRSLNVADLERREDLRQKILDSVESKPF
jgi:hypothetical protein